MAPELFTTDNLPGGWKAIVMEFIQGSTLHTLRHDLSLQQKEEIQKLQTTIQQMETNIWEVGGN